MRTIYAIAPWEYAGADFAPNPHAFTRKERIAIGVVELEGRARNLHLLSGLSEGNDDNTTRKPQPTGFFSSNGMGERRPTSNPSTPK